MNVILHFRTLFCFREAHVAHRGSYMSAHVLLNLLNELGSAVAQW